MPGQIPAQVSKMPEHSGTCYRVQMSVAPECVMDDRTIKIVMHANPAGQPVGVLGIRCEFYLRIMKFVTPECGISQGTVTRARAYDITDDPF